VIINATDALYLLSGVHKHQAAATPRDFAEAAAIAAALAAKCEYTRAWLERRATQPAPARAA
jgi:hypothetical protein